MSSKATTLRKGTRAGAAQVLDWKRTPGVARTRRGSGYLLVDPVYPWHHTSPVQRISCALGVFGSPTLPAIHEPTALPRNPPHPDPLHRHADTGPRLHPTSHTMSLRIPSEFHKRAWEASAQIFIASGYRVDSKDTRPFSLTASMGWNYLSTFYGSMVVGSFECGC